MYRFHLVCLWISCWYILSSSAQGQCTNGFTDESSLTTDGAVTRPGFFYLFFNSVNFTCEVEVASFTLLAQTITGSTGAYPRIQIYRQGNEVNEYTRIHDIGANDEVTSLGSSLYQYTPNNGPIAVLPGDVLGLLVQSRVNIRISPYFMNESGIEYFEASRSMSSLDLTTILITSSIGTIANRYSPLIAVTLNQPSSSIANSMSSLIDAPSVSSSPAVTAITSSTVSSVDDVISFSIPVTRVSMSSTPVASIPMSNTPITSILSTSVSIASTSISVTSMPLSSVPVTVVTLSSVPSVNTTTSTPDTSPNIGTTSFVPPLSPSLTSSPSPSLTSSPFPSLISSSSPTVGTSPLSAAVVGGIAVACVLVFVIIGLVFVLVLLFGVGRKKGRKKSFYPPVIQNDGQLENPNYTAVISVALDNRGLASKTSTISGDQFVNHYEIPSYQDPVHSPTVEGFYDEAVATNTVGVTAIYDEANVTTGGLRSIYHELGPEEPYEPHYEMNEGSNPIQANPSAHYEMNDEFTKAVPSFYEQPVSSRNNTLRNATTNHYDLAGSIQDTESRPLPHDYSVLSDHDICVPTEAERLQMFESHSNHQPVFDNERIYSQLGVLQRQKYENIMFFEEADIYWSPAAQTTVLYDQLARRKYREIRRNQLRIVKHLGSGQFGTVNEGVWQSPNGVMGVAIKMLPENSIEAEKVKLLQEAAIMGQFSHPNVVRLHGVVTVGEPVMIVIELMRNGDLREHLKSVRQRSGESPHSSLPSQLLEFCQQIAKGMNYLSKKSFVHRDLAARNIFLDENHVCKIGDFGMSRDLEDENYYISHGGKIPVKWTAPEALQYKRYAAPSDVWSYGAVLYEIWSLGHKPFEGFSNPQTVDMVQSGYRLPPPPGCPRGIYQLMIHCWHPDSSRRPTFSDVLDSLSDNPRKLLSWRDVDKLVHPQSFILGSPLVAGQDLYQELQQTFIKSTLKF